jgi:hypothetical protein
VRGVLRGLNLDANHTWSRCVSDRIAPGIPNPNETFHRGRDRSYCGSDRRHMFIMSAVATAPELDNRLWNAVASDWRVAVLYRATSGEPLSITAGSDRALTGLGGQTVDQVSQDVYLDTSGELGSQYFNPAAFAQPTLGTYGNTNFFQFRGPATWNVDLALSRIFNFGTQRIEARWEVFNVPNAVVPTNPVTSLADPNFGRVRTARDPRIMQFALKYVF